jgi:ankyrin repeat protein
MTEPADLTWRASLAEYERQAASLHESLHAGDHDAAWRYKWVHPRFRGKILGEVLAALPSLDLDDARTVIAHDYSFDTWAGLVAFTEAVERDPRTRQFEIMADAVVSGDIDRLRSALEADPGLIKARSVRRHHATLLHYIGANGVEGVRQKTPANAVAVAKLLLDAGAEVDAVADMYENKCTTMSMLVSSSHPAEGGVQAALAEVLIDYGSEIDNGPGTEWKSALMTALVFGYLDTARALVRRGAAVKAVHTAAGLGRVDDVKRLLPESTPEGRHSALALAAQLGHAETVRVLLDAGEDPNRYNPEGHHSHATPLHQAIWGNHMAVVRLLVERGASLQAKDLTFEGTPLGWAEYGGRTEIAEYLRWLGAPP